MVGFRLKPPSRPAPVGRVGAGEGAIAFGAGVLGALKKPGRFQRKEGAYSAASVCIEWMGLCGRGQGRVSQLSGWVTAEEGLIGARLD